MKEKEIEHLFVVAHEVLGFNNQIELKSLVESNNFEFKSLANLSIEDLNFKIKAESTNEDVVF